MPRPLPWYHILNHCAYELDGELVHFTVICTWEEHSRMAALRLEGLHPDAIRDAFFDHFIHL